MLVARLLDSELEDALGQFRLKVRCASSEGHADAASLRAAYDTFLALSYAALVCRRNVSPATAPAGDARAVFAMVFALRSSVRL